jgi:Cysteine-rich secretory protein family
MIRVRTLVLVAVVSAACAPVVSQAQQFDEQAEQLVLEQLNESRQQAGLAPLKMSPELVQAARQHSVVMARQRKLSHQLPGESQLQERLAVTGAHFFRSGENVGFNTQADLIHEAFMHSPPHRQNLLTPEYNSVGIGIVHQGDAYWVTEDFAQTVVALSVDQASARAAHAFAELRRQERQMPLAQVQIPRLREAACAMAKTGDMNNRSLLQMQGVRYTITYSNAQPEVLPPDISRIAAQPSLKKFAVGSCFVQNERAPGGMFWMAMVFFGD